MRKKTVRCAASAALVLGAAVTALALEGVGGSTVAEQFDLADLVAGVTYPGGFGGVAWSDLDWVSLGSPGGSGGFEQGDDMAADAAGNVYVIVSGSDGTDAYTGLVRWDGNSFANLLQDKMSGDGAETTGTLLRTVSMSPVTAGNLTAGHPVITRHRKTITTQVNVDVMSVDPSSGDETFLYSWTTGALNPEAILAIAGDGTIYALGGINAPTRTIRELSWNEGTGSYDESVISDAVFGHGLTVGPDGYLYSFLRSDEWSTLFFPYADHQVLRIDPADGTFATWAYVDGESFVYDWTWSTDGKLWIGLMARAKSRKQAPPRYVVEVTAGAVAGPDTRVSNSTTPPDSLAAAADGALYVMEGANVGTGAGAVYLLTPGSGGGSGGGGGKGKNK